LERLKLLFVLGDFLKRKQVAERIRLRAQLAILTPPTLPGLKRAAELLQDFGTTCDATKLREKKKILRSHIYQDNAC